MSMSSWIGALVDGICGTVADYRSPSWRRRRVHAPRTTEPLETRMLLSSTNGMEDPGSTPLMGPFGYTTPNSPSTTQSATGNGSGSGYGSGFDSGSGSGSGSGSSSGSGSGAGAGSGSGINSAPVAVDDVANTIHNRLYANRVDWNDYDPDGDWLAFSLTSAPLHGSVLMNLDGSYTYTSNAMFIGADSFTYTMSDGQLWDVGQVFLSVENTVPQPSDDSAFTVQGYAITANVAQNDGLIQSGLNWQDYDWDSTSIVVIDNVTHGTLSLNAATGEYVYQPNLGFSGNDSFTYKLFDGIALSEYTATVNIFVLASNSNGDDSGGGTGTGGTGTGGTGTGGTGTGGTAIAISNASLTVPEQTVYTIYEMGKSIIVGQVSLSITNDTKLTLGAQYGFTPDGTRIQFYFNRFTLDLDGVVRSAGFQLDFESCSHYEFEVPCPIAHKPNQLSSP